MWKGGNGNGAVEGVVTEEWKALFENECATCTVVGRKESAIIFESDDKETEETVISASDTENPKTKQHFTACKDAL